MIQVEIEVFPQIYVTTKMSTEGLGTLEVSQEVMDLQFNMNTTAAGNYTATTVPEKNRQLRLSYLTSTSHFEYHEVVTVADLCTPPADATFDKEAWYKGDAMFNSMWYYGWLPV